VDDVGAPRFTAGGATVGWNDTEDIENIPKTGLSVH
jgi:hypothetical protein